MKFYEKVNKTKRLNSAVDTRVASRSVCIKDDKVLMVHNKADDAYSFPGGGVETEESLESACIRETLEESGYRVKVIEHMGVIDEYFDDKYELNKVFNMKSHYFLCESICEEFQTLDKYELEWDFEPIWIEPMLALNHNLKLKSNLTFSTKKRRYLDRGIFVLKHIISSKYYFQDS